MLKSAFMPVCAVNLPSPERGRQLYMHGFDIGRPTLPRGFEDYKWPILKTLVNLPHMVGKAWLTIDEKVVKAGMSQRKPGPHVDGCFMEDSAGRDWRHGGGWNHTCNVIPGRMAIVTAATVPGCRVYEGEFDGQPESDGNLSHIKDQLGSGAVLSADFAYLLSPDCVHESVIFEVDTPRTFMRIALPVVT